ncbi:MAG: hypothetical protein RLZ77_1433 [Bacteroidota bacterium]|jgi:hypothetical protein
MRYSQDVIKVVLPAGQTTVEQTQTLRPGQIIRVAKYVPSTGDDAGFTAQVGTNSEPDYCKMQPIESYRDRDSDYINGKMPFEIQGGQNVTVKLQAAAAKGSSTTVYFVFVYAS